MRQARDLAPQAQERGMLAATILPCLLIVEAFGPNCAKKEEEEMSYSNPPSRSCHPRSRDNHSPCAHLPVKQNVAKRHVNGMEQERLGLRASCNSLLKRHYLNKRESKEGGRKILQDAKEGTIQPKRKRNRNGYPQLLRTRPYPKLMLLMIVLHPNQAVATSNRTSPLNVPR